MGVGQPHYATLKACISSPRLDDSRFLHDRRREAEAQQRADAVFLEVVRLQGELAVRRHNQRLARFILLSTPDGAPVEPMGADLHA